MSDNGCTCHRCEAVYKIDLLVRDEDWRRVSGGCNLLCPACIMQSLEDIEGFGAYRLHGVDELAAKDAEIAELRDKAHGTNRLIQAIHAHGVQLEKERDEARECVGRLYRWANEHADCLQLEIDNAKLERKRKCYAEELASLHAALAATPEHLRK